MEYKQDLFRAGDYGVYVFVYENRQGELEMNIVDDYGGNITISKKQAEKLLQFIKVGLTYLD